MDLCSIASGSSGNCIYIGDKNTKILVDVGVSKKRIESGLESIGVPIDQLNAIFITHEHSDHIKGLGIIARKYHIPIYATLETRDAILEIGTIGKMDLELFCSVYPDHSVSIGDFTIEPFSVSHDAVNPVGYTVEKEGHKIGVATDLGMYNEYTIAHLKNSEILLLEANHDVHMLEAGMYPYSLKRRILGEKGHLSNENAGKLLCEIWSKQLKHIFLGHLSKENNYPDLAYEAVKMELEKKYSGYSTDTSLLVTKREEPSAMVSV